VSSGTRQPTRRPWHPASQSAQHRATTAGGWKRRTKRLDEYQLERVLCLNHRHDDVDDGRERVCWPERNSPTLFPSTFPPPPQQQQQQGHKFSFTNNRDWGGSSTPIIPRDLKTANGIPTCLIPRSCCCVHCYLFYTSVVWHLDLHIKFPSRIFGTQHNSSNNIPAKSLSPDARRNIYSI
jgi:hypothetical protein